MEVSDNGVGISPDNQSNLFNEIVQFDAAKLYGGGGSGLGLRSECIFNLIVLLLTNLLV